jgi:hypothetical protein
VDRTLPHLQLKRSPLRGEKMMFEAIQGIFSEVIQQSAMNQQVILCFLAPGCHAEEEYMPCVTRSAPPRKSTWFTCEMSGSWFPLTKIALQPTW